MAMTLTLLGNREFFVFASLFLCVFMGLVTCSVVVSLFVLFVSFALFASFALFLFYHTISPFPFLLQVSCRSMPCRL